MKKITSYLLSFIGVLLVLGVLAPVNVDAGACGGGYRTHVVNLYKQDFAQLILAQPGVKADSFSKLSCNPEELSGNMDWQGRTIRTKAVYKHNMTDYLVEFEGKRYWFEHYRWKIKRIVDLGYAK